jgi:hypothetical protein
MTKFTSTDDPGFVAVCGELRRWIRGIDTAERHRETLSYNRDRNEQPGNDPEACRVIPLLRNEDVVDRTHIFTRLDALLPSPSEYQSAALYGLGGSG